MRSGRVCTGASAKTGAVDRINRGRQGSVAFGYPSRCQIISRHCGTSYWFLERGRCFLRRRSLSPLRHNDDGCDDWYQEDGVPKEGSLGDTFSSMIAAVDTEYTARNSSAARTTMRIAPGGKSDAGDKPPEIRNERKLPEFGSAEPARPHPDSRPHGPWPSTPPASGSSSPHAPYGPSGDSPFSTFSGDGISFVSQNVVLQRTIGELIQSSQG